MTTIPSTPSAPAHWTCDVVLADGGTVHIRPIGPEDAASLAAFHEALSPGTVYFRFFTAYPRLSPSQLEHFTHVDHDARVALVAELGERFVGVGRYDREPGTDSAEVAFVVSDAHQGRGSARSCSSTWPPQPASEVSPGSSP